MSSTEEIVETTHAGSAITTHEYDVEHGTGEQAHHPSEKQYIVIALILAVITAVEVSVSYIKSLGDAGNPLLLILAAIKFVMVAGYFMHLKFDHRLLRRFFVTGFVLAIFCYFVVFLMFGILG